MSSLIVETTKITEVLPHPNADRLEIAVVKGWQVIVQKDKYKAGDIIIFVPPDSVLTQELSNKLNVTQYLSKQKVRPARLRGVMSFGLTIDCEFAGVEKVEGIDCKDILQITKYEPPEYMITGDTEKPHPLFINYTDIENIRNFPEVLKEDEMVYVTEKIHGTNARVGLIEEEFMIGSHKMRKKFGQKSMYEKPLTEEMKHFLLELKKIYNAKQVIVFGEIYGAGITKLHYGAKKEKGFKIFDIFIDGKYLDYADTYNFAHEYKIDMVPLLYFGKFSVNKMKEITNGNSTLDNHIKEGIVIRPKNERNYSETYPERAIFKLFNDDYLLKDYN